jgi:hypothetical protein
MKEGQYHRFDQDSLNAAEDQYFANIRHDKELVWERIEESLTKKKIIPLWIYYAAASILMLIGIGTLFMYQLDKKNEEIARLKYHFKTLQAQKQDLEIVQNTEYKIDTILIHHEKLVSEPVTCRDTLVVHDTIRQMMVRNDTVYMKQAQQEGIAGNNFLASEEVKTNPSIGTNPKSKRKRGERRFIFQFGKPKYEKSDVAQQSLISFSTK